MDLIYLSDVMAYHSIRGPAYDRYDQTWDQNIQKGKQRQQRVNNGREEKKPCKICQERQKRSLMAYIRSKSHESCGEDQIIEEEEEEEEEETATQQKETTNQADKKQP